MVSISYNVRDPLNPLHAVEIKNSVITLFYKEHYKKDDLVALYTHSKDRLDKKYRFVKHADGDHIHIHQDNTIQLLFHRHFDLGRTVEFEDVRHCLEKQRIVLSQLNVTFKEYDYDSLAFDFRRQEEGFKGLPPDSDTTLITMLKNHHPRFFGEYSRSLKVNALMETKTDEEKSFAKKIQSTLRAGMFYHQETLFVLPGINLPSENKSAPSLGNKIQSAFGTH